MNTIKLKDFIDLVVDCGRRDLTINAMAMDGDILIDPYGGLANLRNKIIRHVNPDAFADDPVRVLRATRFAARYSNFGVADETVQLMKQCVQTEFDNLTPERVWKEIEKGLSEKDFVAMLEWLVIVGADRVLSPYKMESEHNFLLYKAESIGASPEVKFALVSKNFTKSDFTKWKIPNNFSELSLMNSSLDSRISDKSSVEDILDFIEKTGAIKSSKRFQDALDLVHIQMPKFYRTCLSCVDKLKTIDNVKVIGDEKNGVKIKELVRQERLRVISEVLL